MKLLLLLLLGLPFTLHHAASYHLTIENGKTGLLVNEIVGQWKKNAAGQDANSNRILEESEKMKLEPGAQDNIHLNADGKCKVFGMGMELDGTWLTKNYNGKKTLFIYTNDIANLPQEDKDKSAMRFEIVSLKDGKLVVIPPIFTFMLAEYVRSK